MSVGVGVGAGVDVCDVVVVSYLSLRTSFGGGGPLFGRSAISMKACRDESVLPVEGPGLSCGW